jgi:hypothetical protein
MGSESPNSPRLFKGALAVYPSQTPGTQPKIIVFQYNPEQLRRTLAARTQPPDKGNAGAAREEALRVFGPPVETITMTVELSAADQLEDPGNNPTVVQNGLQPALSTLELLLYPSTDTAQAQQQQARNGKVQVTPSDLPLTLLVWGKSRVVPVLVTSFSVTEDAFDVNLNPIQAKVELGLKVLTYMELQGGSLGNDAFLSYQRQKETLAQLNQPQGDQNQIRGLLPA